MVYGDSRLRGLNSVVIFFRKLCLVWLWFLLGSLILNLNILFIGYYKILSVLIVGSFVLLRLILVV